MSIEKELTQGDNFLDNVVKNFKDQGNSEGRVRRISLWQTDTVTGTLRLRRWDWVGLNSKKHLDDLEILI